MCGRGSSTDGRGPGMDWGEYAVGALFLAAALLLLLFGGCSPRVVETVRTEYVYRDRVQVDTTVLKDSVFIEKYIRGDTVRVTEYRDRLVYQYRLLRDTLAVHDTTTVETVREVTVREERRLNAWQRFRIGAFWWLLGLVAFAYRKELFAILKKAFGHY